MATLVLGVVGSIFGGRMGRAIGEVVGNAIDREILFKPKGREGPRLSDLKLQTSSYGTEIPQLFGTLRVAGSVIWSTDLIEHRSREGGKGRPTVTTYSYTASFAVALSARPILGVGRIWADGKLLRGAAGDFKTRTGFRLHLGGEDQATDPLIAAAEGAGLTPAHRGIAYAVFEDLELGDFGNRIPALTFEVQADAGAVEAGLVAEAVGAGLVVREGEGLMLGGFAAQGDARAMLETLAGADGGWFAAEAEGLRLLRGSGDVATLADADMRAAGRQGPRGGRSIAAAESTPRVLSLTHYDAARDYQIGMQRAASSGAGTREARMELPAVVEASVAKTVAEAALVRMDVERERRSVALGWEALAVAPGARVAIDGVPGLWRVDRWGLEAMVVTLECVAVAPASAPAEASGGRVLPAPDLALGETIVHAFELPPLDETPAGAPRLAIAAGGTEVGWRSAALLISTDDGARWEAAGRTAAPAVLGTVTVPPAGAPAALTDLVNRVEVELAHSGMVLADADDAGLAAGANLAMLGDELVQFGRAEPLGESRWRLSRLWRGRRGSEAAIGTQVEGDRFVLIETETVRVVELPLAALGGTAEILAEGAGDDEAAGAEAVLAGWSVVPPAPVHLCAATPGDGTTALAWVRRSRAGWRWIDGVDAPLGEESERYRVTIAPEGGAERVIELTAPAATLAPGDREGACLVTVRQVGSHGLSPPAVLALPALGD